MKRFLELHAKTILVVWIVILSIAYSTLSILRHNHFESGGFDLGLYDQAVWQYSRFLWPYNTIKERFILGDHLTLTLPLLAPLFWLWDNVRILLVFQAVWISASTIAIYLLARTRKFSSFTALVISVLYSLFYGIQFGVFSDFHPVMLGAGLVAWLVYFLESKKKTGTFITLGLLLLTQENMGLTLTALGLVYLFRKEFRRQAILWIVLGIPVSLVASKIIAFFSPGGFQYWPQLSPSPISLLIQFFDTAEKRQVWLYTLSWFSFLPIFSPGAMLAVLFDLSQYFVTGPEFSRMWSPFMHHRVTLAPLLTLGTMETLELLRRKKVDIQLVSVLLLTVAVFLQFYFHLPLNKLSKKEYWRQEPWMLDNQNMIASIPPRARLATQQNLVPHVSHREYIYLAWPHQHDFEPSPCGAKSCWWLDFDKNTEYLLVDLRPNQWLTQILETNEHFIEAVRNMEKAGKITLERSFNNSKLYRVHL